MSTFVRVLADLAERFEANNFEYMLVGSFATGLYGEPRLTHDLDIVLDVLASDVNTFVTAFSGDDYYIPPQEDITKAIQSHSQFNLLHHETGIKIDLILRKESTFAKHEFKRKQRVELDETTICFVASPEDVIIKKLEFYQLGGSEKHLKDVRGILANQKLDMYREYLEKWVAQLGLLNGWNEVN